MSFSGTKIGSISRGSAGIATHPGSNQQTPHFTGWVVKIFWTSLRSENRLTSTTLLHRFPLIVLLLGPLEPGLVMAGPSVCRGSLESLQPGNQSIRRKG